MPDLRTLEQDRVAAALKATGDLNQDGAKKYFNDAARFGPLVVSNGLAGAAAFAAEKFNSKFSDHLNQWIATRPEFNKLAGRTILEKVSKPECGAADYRRMTQEVLAYTNWLKRLAGAKKNA